MNDWNETMEYLLRDERSISELEKELQELGSRYDNLKKELDKIVHDSIVINSTILLKIQEKEADDLE